MIQGLVVASLVLSVAVLAGWFLGGSTWITSVLPGAVTMKPVTALTVALSSLGVLVERHRLISVTLFAGAAGLMVGAQIGWVPGFLQLEEAGAMFSSAPNIPSIGTTVGFTMLAVAAMIGSSATALSAAAVGAFCLAGYALRVPELFFYVPEVSTAMAVHTGALLAILGIAMGRSPAFRKRAEAVANG